VTTTPGARSYHLTLRATDPAVHARVSVPYPGEPQNQAPPAPAEQKPKVKCGFNEEVIPAAQKRTGGELHRWKGAPGIRLSTRKVTRDPDSYRISGIQGGGPIKVYNDGRKTFVVIMTEEI